MLVAIGLLTNVGTFVALAVYLNKVFDHWKLSYPAAIVAREMHTINSAVAVSLGVGVVISSVLTILISHRIVGPLYRLRQYFHRMAEDPSVVKEPIQFRKGDFFADLPPTVNRALEAVSKHNQRG
jgi:hypothetical protein